MLNMKVKRRNSWLLVLIVSLLCAITVVVAYIGYLLLTTPIDAIPSIDSGGISVINPPLPIADFTLTNQDNEDITLSDLAGKPTLITFGFTHCPDICPYTIGEFRTIHREFGTLSNDINFVFISVDGERDTPEVLKNYFELLQVDSFLIGMTASPRVVRERTKDFGVDFISSEIDSNGNYDVQHTAGMFLLDSDGDWIRRYSYGTAATLIVDDIQDFLAGDK
jgi:protein SCO1/2